MGEIILKTLAVAILATFFIVGIISLILRMRSDYRWYDNLPRRKRLTREELKKLKRLNDGWI